MWHMSGFAALNRGGMHNLLPFAFYDGLAVAIISNLPSFSSS